MEKINQEELTMLGIDHQLDLTPIPHRSSHQPHQKAKSHHKFLTTQDRLEHLDLQQVMRKKVLEERIKEKQQKTKKKVAENVAARKQRSLVKNRTLGKIEQNCAENERQNASNETFLRFYRKEKNIKRQNLNNSSHHTINKSMDIKENLCKIYNTPKIAHLPQLKKIATRERPKELSPSPQKRSSQSVSLLDFGIFSEHKTCESFMKKLKYTIQKEFPLALNPNCIEDILKFEIILLKQLKNQGQCFSDC